MNANVNATKNIRVNAVCPGYTESALLDKLLAARPDMDAILKSVIPMKRYGDASEIAEAIVWLPRTPQSLLLDKQLYWMGELPSRKKMFSI